MEMRPKHLLVVILFFRQPATDFWSTFASKFASMVHKSLHFTDPGRSVVGCTVSTCICGSRQIFQSVAQGSLLLVEQATRDIADVVGDD